MVVIFLFHDKTFSILTDRGLFVVAITKSHTNYIYINSIFFWQVFSFAAGYLLMANEISFLNIVALSGTGLLLGLSTASLFLLVIAIKKNDNERDPMTQSFSRSNYRKIFNSWCKNKVDFSLILIDIDYFNSINATYGHKVGDEILLNLSELITNNTKRTKDIVAHHGDGKFILMVNQNNLASASNIAMRLHKKINHTLMPSAIHLTCSFGVAQYRADNDSSNTLFERAEKALLQSKNNGKNCVAMESAA